MANSLNKVILIGNINQDPEIIKTSDGKKMATLTLATTENWKDKISGEKKEKVELHKVVIFNEILVGAVENFAKKGNKVYVEGNLQTRKWQDPATNQDKYTTEIVLNFGANFVLLDNRENNDNTNSLNKVTLIGNLGRDPEIRKTSDGKKIASLNMATSESWKDKISGEKKEKTEWHKVIVFNEPLVNVIESYVKKGNKVYVEGNLQTRKWQDQTTNQDRYITEVVLNFGAHFILLDTKGNNDNLSEGTYKTFQDNNSNNSFIDDSEVDDDIPF